MNLLNILIHTGYIHGRAYIHQEELFKRAIQVCSPMSHLFFSTLIIIMINRKLKLI